MFNRTNELQRDRTRLPHAKRETLARREARRFKSAAAFLAAAFDSQPAF